ncbi:MAG: phenylalanine--tRNA ligase subunit beta [Elusimicrobiota bacterium]
MKFSYNWLKEFVPLTFPPRELAERLNLSGFEVDSLTELGPSFTGVVVGKVLKVEKHPNADRLSVCEVTDGRQSYPVVCGAANVAAGQTVPFARLGAKLPGDFTIKKAKIRGAVSEGMICSAAELGLPGAGGKEAGIMVLEPASELGTDFLSLLGLSDAILDVDVKPNRGDCLSHFGLARELATHFKTDLATPKSKPFNETGPASLPVEVLDPSECPRYLGRLIEGIKVGPSPAWLAKKLEAAGLRPINNVVDVTNYILLELGQPLHAFDADKLAGAIIRVRLAGPGEKIAALDGRTYSLTPENLVIADAEKAVAVAGVIGGEATAVSDSTRRVFLECANFRPGRVRRSRRSLGLATDSSFRFERGVDMAGAPAAAARAASLLLELCGGNAGPVGDTCPSPKSRAAVTISVKRLQASLGTDFPEGEVLDTLRRVCERVEGSPDALSVLPPSYRLDLESSADLAEEVARHLGYDRVPGIAGPASTPAPEPVPMRDAAERVRATLCGMGFFEAYNYDFLSKAELERHLGGPPAPDAPRLANPVSEDYVYMRPTLLVGLLRNAALNAHRGAAGVRFFELGQVYRRRSEEPRLAGLWVGPHPATPHWQGGCREPDFYAVKGVVEGLCADASWREPASPDPAFHPKAVLELVRSDGRSLGSAGLLHPELLLRWDLRSKTVAAFELDLAGLAAARSRRFAPFSIYPGSSRDLCLVVDAGLPYGAPRDRALRLGLAELKRLDIIDVFTGEGLPPGKKSLTLRLTFSRADRTLRDEEVQAAVDRVLEALRKDCGAELRS